MSRWTTFDPTHPTEIPAQGACYAIYIDGALAYIGQTIDLRSRCRNHGFRLSTTSNWIVTPWGRFRDVRGKYKQSAQYGDWAMAELRLLSRLSPRMNRRRPGTEDA